MTPKEKAEELIDKMERPLNDDYAVDYNPYYKECALIAVDEILSMGIMSESGDWEMAKSYWQEVKNEIEKL